MRLFKRNQPFTPIDGAIIQASQVVKTYDTGSKIGFLLANVVYGLERPDLGPELRKELVAARISVTVAGAEVTVDGRKVGVSPIEHEVFLDPAVRATIEARLAGHEAAREVVEGKKGEELRVELWFPSDEATARVVRGLAGAPAQRRSRGRGGVGSADRLAEEAERAL